jgi:hypothetical protein
MREKRGCGDACTTDVLLCRGKPITIRQRGIDLHQKRSWNFVATYLQG